MPSQNMVSPDDNEHEFAIVGKVINKDMKEAIKFGEAFKKVLTEVEKITERISKNLNNTTGKPGSGKLGLGEIVRTLTPAQKTVGIGLGVAAVGAGVANMFPSTNMAVTQRMASDFVAGLSGMSPMGVISQSNRLVGMGATSALGPTMAQMNLTYQGGYLASDLSSRNVMSSIGGLSALSGGSNEQVASALAGMNGMNFLRAGIRIRDNNGQLRPIPQIVNDVYNRLYGAQKITADQAATLYSPTSKGYQTINMLTGGDQNLNGIIISAIQARAKSGRPLTQGDLGNAQNALNAVGVAGNSPVRAQFNYNAAQAKSLQVASPGLVGGYNAALNTSATLTNGLSDMAGAVQGVTNALLGLRGFLNTFPNAGGVGGGISGLAGTAMGIGSSMMQARIIGQMLGSGGGGATGAIAQAAAKDGWMLPAAARSGLRLAGLARYGGTAAVGAAAKYGLDKFVGSRVSPGVKRAGDIAATMGIDAAAGAAIGSIVPGIGTGIGALLGTAYGAFSSFGHGGDAHDSIAKTDPSTRGGYYLPVPSKTPVTSGFGPRKGVGATGFHSGIDFGTRVGTPVTASANGTVTSTGNRSDYGNYVIIQHGSKSSLYAHLSKINVKVGQKVSAGEPIGLSGGQKGAAGAGDSTGPHLHYELRDNGGFGAGGRVDPAKTFNGSQGLFSRIFNDVKSFLGFGGSKHAPSANAAATGLNMQHKTTADLSSSGINGIISGLTHGGEPISYADLQKHMTNAQLSKLAKQNIDYSHISGGGKVAHKDLMNMLYRKGFTGKALDTAFAVSLAESGGRAGAIGDVGLQDSKWGPSIGLFQIRSLKNWKAYNDPYRDAHRLPSAPFNVEAALDKSNHGRSWSAWSTYTSGAFTKFLADAVATKAAAKIPSYDKGSTRIEQDQLAVVHKDEAVLTKTQADKWRRGEGMGGIDIKVNMNVNIANAGLPQVQHLLKEFRTQLERDLKLKGIGNY